MVIPIGKKADIKTKPSIKKRELEDYNPGTSRSEVFNALKKVANAPKSKPSKNG